MAVHGPTYDKEFPPRGPMRDDKEIVASTSHAVAEAEQGDGPAAASGSSSAAGPRGMMVDNVAVVVGAHGAAAASRIGVVSVTPDGAAAASEVGTAAVGHEGAAATSNAANSSTTQVKGGQPSSGTDGQNE
jgi:hypothetical protein